MIHRFGQLFFAGCCLWSVGNLTHSAADGIGGVNLTRMQELLRSATDGEFDVLLIVDAEHLFCTQAEIEGLISTLLRSGVHTFCAKSGHWLEPNGRHWMVLPNYDSINMDDWEGFDV